MIVKERQKGIERVFKEEMILLQLQKDMILHLAATFQGIRIDQFRMANCMWHVPSILASRGPWRTVHV